TEGLTMTGAAIGTPHYMSPEQCHAMPLSGATDQYSLGVTAYQMITGSLPFEGGSAMNIMFKHAHEPPAPLLERVPDCPPELATVVERMLAKKPEDRFARMEDVVRALNAPMMDHDDPVRSQLIQYALQGENRRLLKRVSTPRSPVSAVLANQLGRSPKTRRGAAPKPAGKTTTLVPPAQPESRRNPLLIGGAVLAVAALAALAVLQPWKSRAIDPKPTSELAGHVLATVPQPGPAAPDSNAAAVASQAESTAATMNSTQAVPPPTVAVTPKPVVPKPTPTKPQRPAGRTDPAPSLPAASRLAELQSVQVTGPNSLNAGESAQLDADPLDASGHSVTGRQIVWRSSAPDVVTVNASGQVTGRQAGRAVISATVDQVSGSMAVVVQAATVTLSITPADLTLEAGKSGTLSANLLGAGARPADHTVQWSSGAPQVATVNADGTVTARSAGTATITAVTAGRQATSTVTVTAAAGPSEDELRTQVDGTIQAYARALESRDVGRVRQVFPSMTSLREQQLKQALPNMKNLQVRLTLNELQLSGDNATAVVSGKWLFQAAGQRNELPADNVYQLARRGTGWVITEIR
ncbi:MAG: Ig-like domain-containing protein, partial [Gemmatimonadota bacterium]